MLGDVLSGFKKDEKSHAENIIPLTESEELRNGIVAWKSVVIKYKQASECPYEDEAARWDWMWKQVEFDLKQFAVVAGVNPQHQGRLFGRLKGLRLIYPDGTINTLAARYLQGMVMAKLPKS
jgi:hypothetical protein